MAKGTFLDLRVSNLRTGFWCEEHALSHGVRYDAVVLQADGVDTLAEDGWMCDG